MGLCFVRKDSLNPCRVCQRTEHEALGKLPIGVYGQRQVAETTPDNSCPAEQRYMSEYLLKDTASKEILRAWLVSAMERYGGEARLKWNDEDTLCEHFFKCLSGQVTMPTGKLEVTSYKTRGRGPGAGEKKLGADGIGLVFINTLKTSLAGFFLFQAKKAETQCRSLQDASIECSTMLSHSAASYLLVLFPSEVNMVGAMAIEACKKKDPPLKMVPYIGFPRFFVEHILTGIMLEPLCRHDKISSDELRREIRHVITFVVSESDGI